MNVMLPTRRMTVEEFFAWSEEHPEAGRCELIDGVVVVQQSESWGHTQTKFAIAMAFVESIRRSGLPLFAAPSGPATRIASDTAFQPDVIVAHLPHPDRKSYEITTAVIVVEVLSPSTRRKDLGRKRHGYFSLPTVRHYLIVDPDAGTILKLSRATETGDVTEETVASGELVLDPPGLSLDVAAIFN